MAQIPNSVRLGGFIAPFEDYNTYPVTDETYNKGGYRAVSATTERDAITSDRRKDGMLVYCSADTTTYILSGSLTNSDWSEYSLGLSSHSHPASDITAGTFGAGDYTIAGDLNVQVLSARSDCYLNYLDNNDVSGLYWYNTTHTGASLMFTRVAGVEADGYFTFSHDLIASGDVIIEGNLISNHTHNASGITAGTFDGGSYILPGYLTLTDGTIKTTAPVESSEGPLTIGTDNPSGATSIVFQTGATENDKKYTLFCYPDTVEEGGYDFKLSYTKDDIWSVLHVSGEARTMGIWNTSPTYALDIGTHGGADGKIRSAGGYYGNKDINYYTNGSITTGNTIESGSSHNFVAYDDKFGEPWTFYRDTDGFTYSSGTKDFSIYWDEDKNEYHLIGIRSIATGQTGGELAYSSCTDFIWAKSSNLSGDSWSMGNDTGVIDSICGIEVDGQQIDMVWAPHVFKNDNAYYMFYAGVDWDGAAGTNGPNVKQRIFAAKTYDINNWSSPEIKYCFDGTADWSTYAEVEGWTYHCRDPYVIFDEEYDRWLMFVTTQVESGYSEHGARRACLGLATATTLMGDWTLYDWVRATEHSVAETPSVFQGPDGLWYLTWTYSSAGSSWGGEIRWASGASLSDVTGYTIMPDLEIPDVAAELFPHPAIDNLWLFPSVEPYDYIPQIRFDKALTFTGGNNTLTYTSHSAIDIASAVTTYSYDTVHMNDQLFGHMGERNIHIDQNEIKAIFDNRYDLTSHTHYYSAITDTAHTQNASTIEPGMFGGSGSYSVPNNFFVGASMGISGDSLYLDYNSNQSESGIYFRGDADLWVIANFAANETRWGPAGHKVAVYDDICVGSNHLYLSNFANDGAYGGNNVDGAGIWFGSGSSSYNIAYNSSSTSISANTNFDVGGEIRSGGTNITSLMGSDGSDHGHPASDITAGAFDAGDYVIDGNFTATTISGGSYDGIDASMVAGGTFPNATFTFPGVLNVLQLNSERYVAANYNNARETSKMFWNHNDSYNGAYLQIDTGGTAFELSHGLETPGLTATTVSATSIYTPTISAGSGTYGLSATSLITYGNAFISGLSLSIGEAGGINSSFRMSDNLISSNCSVDPRIGFNKTGPICALDIGTSNGADGTLNAVHISSGGNDLHTYFAVDDHTHTFSEIETTGHTHTEFSGTLLSSGEDLDDYYGADNNGFYNWSTAGSPTNAPAGIGETGYKALIVHYDNSSTHQMAWGGRADNQILAIRRSISDDFTTGTGWKYVLFSGDSHMHDASEITGGTLGGDIFGVGFSASTYSGITVTKGITIPETRSDEDIPIFYTDRSLLFTKTITIVDGSSPTVDWSLKQDANRTNAGTTIISSTADNTTTGSGDTTFTTAAVPAGRWIWLETSATGGTVDQFHLTMTYKED